MYSIIKKEFLNEINSKDEDIQRIGKDALENLNEFVSSNTYPVVYPLTFRVIDEGPFLKSNGFIEDFFGFGRPCSSKEEQKYWNNLLHKMYTREIKLPIISTYCDRIEKQTATAIAEGRELYINEVLEIFN